MSLSFAAQPPQPEQTDDEHPWFLCYFLHRYLDFRLPEAEACAELEGCSKSIAWRLPDGDSPDACFRWMRAPSASKAAAVAQRCLLVKVMLDIWGEGSTLEDCVAAALACPGASLQFHYAKKAPYLVADTTFKVCVDGFGVTYSQSQQIDLIHRLAALPFKGTVKLKHPQHVFWLIETHGKDSGLALPSCQKRFYFGRQLGRGDRSALVSLDLRYRRYLGPTSMDHEMALIMCNMGLVKAGHLVHDPFTGTGSILMAAAHLGALTSGADIDIRVIRDGKRHAVSGQRVNVWTNFDDAKMNRPLHILHCDLAHLPFRHTLQGWAHAWVCDPPYGVRAGGRKAGGRKRDENGNVPAVPEHLRGNHVPSTAGYPLTECIADLLDEAAKALVINGRLVYFYPAAARDVVGTSSVEVDNDELAMAATAHLPHHPCLELVAHSLQMLTSRWGRRLVTMRKTRDWYPEAKSEAAAWNAKSSLDAVRARVMPQDGFAEDEDKVFSWQAYRGKRT